MTTGEKIQKLRKEKNYTQEDLADIVGVSRQSISKWESDIVFPETENLIILSKLFKCTVDFLLNYENDESDKNKDTLKVRIEIFKFDKRKLPLVLSTLVVSLLSFILFSFSWIRASSSSYYIDNNFYDLIFFKVILHNKVENIFACISFAIVLLDILFSFLYLQLNKKWMNLLLKFFNCSLPLILLLIMFSIGLELLAPFFIEEAILIALAFCQYAIPVLRNII